MFAGAIVSTQSYTYTSSGEAIWVYSQDSSIDIFKIQVDSNGISSTSTTTTTTTTTSDASATNTSDDIVVTSYSELLSAISQAENAGGGKIYVSGTGIACSGQIALSKANDNVQIKSC